MKKNEEKSQKRMPSIHSYKIGFWKANWALVVVLFLAFIVIFALGYILLFPYWNKHSLEKDISNIETTSLFSIDKVVCYSSAYGVNNSETQARWNVNLSQYTDIAIYLNMQTNITGMYIDNISFSNSDIGNLSLSYLPAESFGKSPIMDIESFDATSDMSEKKDDTNNILEANDDTNKTTNSVNTINASNTTNSNISDIETYERIDLNLNMPITLRYLNNNLKENCLISDIDTPLSFDGSILKRGKVTISSLKNTISFTLHLIDDTNQEYTYPVNIPINLENAEKEESIYNGSYTDEIPFTNAYFYVKNT